MVARSQKSARSLNRANTAYAVVSGRGTRSKTLIEVGHCLSDVGHFSGRRCSRTLPSHYRADHKDRRDDQKLS